MKRLTPKGNVVHLRHDMMAEGYMARRALCLRPPPSVLLPPGMLLLDEYLPVPGRSYLVTQIDDLDVEIEGENVNRMYATLAELPFPVEFTPYGFEPLLHYPGETAYTAEEQDWLIAECKKYPPTQ